MAIPPNFAITNYMLTLIQSNPHLFWFIIGSLFALVELFVPTAFSLFVTGISAILVGLFALAFPQLLSLQIALWVILSTTFVYLSHRFLPKRRVSSISGAVQAETMTEFLPGAVGRVLYEGASWRARCADEKLAIPANHKVYIVGREGTTLLIMPEYLLD